jgi:hypothetical protein
VVPSLSNGDDGPTGGSPREAAPGLSENDPADAEIDLDGQN